MMPKFAENIVREEATMIHVVFKMWLILDPAMMTKILKCTCESMDRISILLDA